MHTRQETQNLGLKAITDKNGPVPIRFEFGDRETLMPLGEHAAHWANYLRDLVREFFRVLPFLAPNATGAEGGGRGKDWADLQKIYNGKKAALNDKLNWRPDADPGPYDLSKSNSTPSTFRGRWDAQVAFWNGVVSSPHPPDQEPCTGCSLNNKIRQRQGCTDKDPDGDSATREILPDGHGHNPPVLHHAPALVPPIAAMLKKREKTLTKQVNMFMKIFKE
ncbi:hypothetical protein Tco_0499253 [Tanacetum coccineum]